jgi:hypothetical protein
MTGGPDHLGGVGRGIALKKPDGLASFDVVHQDLKSLIRQLHCSNRWSETLKVVHKHDRVVRSVIQGESSIGERGSK